ncbi:uncharacterized protein LOC128245627 isoform X2 [Mya arenaria]|uniref:uncharacterized protein LOC128245627 isoform X2 n=1 Tax=Mya arenaria TaxID=6604 RepID=UPI0022E97C4C|nr:uncharacterized protein LOC128245627 isoform X2 [Mya arenaria]
MTDILRPFTPKRIPKNYYKRGSTMTPRQLQEDRDKYSFRIRPTSAPATSNIQRSRRFTPITVTSEYDFIRRRKVSPKSAKERSTFTDVNDNVNYAYRTDGRTGTTETSDDQDMFAVVRAVKEARTFEEDTEFFRDIQKDMQQPEVGVKEEKKDAAPVFNKRLFASQGSVIITQEARRLMARNSEANVRCDLNTQLTKSQITCLRCVVDGLKLIHKGQDFVKDVLSKVVSYEMYKAFENVPTKSWENELGCHYILNGAVEVTYDLKAVESRNVFQANIIYSHGTGEYLGLVSPEGPTEDLTPPATIYTKELTQFIRIDRARFHALMRKATEMIDKRKRDYVNEYSFLKDVSQEVKEKILHKMAIQEYPANRVLLAQNEMTDYIYVMMKGRCQTYREIFIPEAEREVLFYLTSREKDDFFGEECVLDHAPATCTVVTVTAATCLKLHRSALKMVHRDRLTRYIDCQRHEVPNDRELQNRGYKDSVWNRYKHNQVKASLREGGKLRYLSRPHSATIHERPPTDGEMYTENMRRFVMKGSKYEPLRAKSAVHTRHHRDHRLPRRPKTAISSGLITETAEDDSEKHEASDKENEKGEEVDSGNQGTEETGSKLMSVDKAKEMEKHVEKAMESRESLMKVLDEQSDVSAQLRQAWRADNQQETQNFMKNGVLVTMTSEDIVRKAKALAKGHADKWGARGGGEEEWDTILHAENKQAKMLITANRMRMKDLKRRLAELQKKRERDRKRNAPRQHGEFSESDSD